MKQKKKFTVKCPNCDGPMVGFSEHHAKMNLMIHQRTSLRCKKIRELLKKKGIK